MISQFKKCSDFFVRRFFSKTTAKCWIAGGALRDYFTMGWTSSDLDVYFPNEKELLKAMRELVNAGYSIAYESENSVKLSRGKDQVDLVKVYFASPEETFATFDFTCVCCSVSPEGVWHHPTFFIDLAQKKLVINKLWKPLGTLKRLQKYAKKGYVMENDQLLVLALAIQECDDFDNYDIEDQRKIAQSMSVGVTEQGNVVDASYKDTDLKRGNQNVLSNISDYPSSGKKEDDPFKSVPEEVQDMLDQAGVNADTIASENSYFKASVKPDGGMQTNFDEFAREYAIFDGYQTAEKKELLAQWNKEKADWQMNQLEKHLEARERGEIDTNRLTGDSVFQMNSLDPVIHDKVPKEYKQGGIDETVALIKQKLAEQKKTEAYLKDTSNPLPAPDTRCTDALMQESPELADRLRREFDEYPVRDERFTPDAEPKKKSKKARKGKKAGKSSKD